MAWVLASTLVGSLAAPSSAEAREGRVRAAAGAERAQRPAPVAAGQDGSPRAACLRAAREAERLHRLPDGLMVAIALSESGLHAHALNIGGRSHFPAGFDQAVRLLRAAPPGASVMAGCIQVNARVHARGSDWPLDAARATDWAAAVLRQGYAETGSWTGALRRWHGGSAAGSGRVVCRVHAKLAVAAPDRRGGAAVLDDAGCHAAQAARVRRSGAALLEVAEADER